MIELAMNENLQWNSHMIAYQSLLLVVGVCEISTMCLTSRFLNIPVLRLVSNNLTLCRKWQIDLVEILEAKLAHS